MWALLRAANPAGVARVDPAAASHCIAAVKPFPFLACSLPPGCPLWIISIEGQSFRRKSQGRMGRTPMEM